MTVPEPTLFVAHSNSDIRRSAADLIGHSLCADREARLSAT